MKNSLHMVKFKCADVSGLKMVQSQEIECKSQLQNRGIPYDFLFSVEHKRWCIHLQQLYSIQHNGKSIHTQSAPIPFHLHCMENSSVNSSKHLLLCYTEENQTDWLILFLQVKNIDFFHLASFIKVENTLLSNRLW